jgi:hypothetical protein
MLVDRTAPMHYLRWNEHVLTQAAIGVVLFVAIDFDDHKDRFKHGRHPFHGVQVGLLENTIFVVIYRHDHGSRYLGRCLLCAAYAAGACVGFDSAELVRFLDSGTNSLPGV